MGWIGYVRCKKSRRDFVARTFALIAQVDPVLHRVSCIYEMIPNASQHFVTQQNMSLGSNGADWVRLLRKIPMWLHGTNICINCTSSPILHRVSCSYEMIPNAPKHCETLQNMNLGANGMHRVHLLRKITTWLRGTNYCINCTSSVCLQQVSCSYEMIPNASKYYETDRNISLGSNGAFVAKNPIMTSWHELLYELNQFSMFCNKFHAVAKRSQMHPKTTKQTESLV